VSSAPIRTAGALATHQPANPATPQAAIEAIQSTGARHSKGGGCGGGTMARALARLVVDLLLRQAISCRSSRWR
jgi:hypothetical protein